MTLKEPKKTEDKILAILVKEPFSEHTVTSLSNKLGKSRQGVWKTLNSLSKEKLISMKSIADTKKSVLKINLDLKNIITKKILSLVLTRESIGYERWIFNFKELEKLSYFVILFGSILTNPKEANDIDLLVIGKTSNLKVIDQVSGNIQKTQEKKIHMIELTDEEFIKELNDKNAAYIDALKNGIILFGQDNYIKFIEDVYHD